MPNKPNELTHDVNYHEYISKILEKKKITYNLIEPGMIIDLYYSKSLPTGGKINKRYIVFVLSTKQVPGHDGRFIYGLSLEHVRQSNFTRLVDRMGLDEKSVKLYKAKKVAYPRVLIPEGSNPKSIYNTFIRPKLESTLNESYRQFKKENIVQVFAVKFRWSDKLVKKYLIDNSPNVKGVNPDEGDSAEFTPTIAVTPNK